MQTQAFLGMLNFIGSRTMREYLVEQYSKGQLTLSAEDMLSIAYNSDKSFEERFDYIFTLAPLITEKTAYSSLCHGANLLMSEFPQYHLTLVTKEYVYGDESDIEPVDTITLTFYSVEEAVSYAASQESGCATFSLHSGYKKVLDMITIDSSGIIDFNTTILFDDGPLFRGNDTDPADLLKNRYVYLPNPFSAGDTVCLYDNPFEEYIIIDAEPADPAEYGVPLDYVDMSAMVVPYEFREHATPEKIAEHRRRLEQLREIKQASDIDAITLHHEHIDVLLLELVRKYGS